jgi:hypothetical protein
MRVARQVGCRFSMDENPYEPPRVDATAADNTRAYRVRVVMDEPLLRNALSRSLYQTGCLHNVVGGAFGVLGVFALFQLPQWELIQGIVPPDFAFETLIAVFVGMLVVAYLAGMGALRLNVRLKTQNFKRRAGIGSMRVHLISLHQSHLTVATDQEEIEKELTSIQILKHPDLILILGFGVPIPIPASADFADASFGEFLNVLKQRRRKAWWSAVRG